MKKITLFLAALMACTMSYAQTPEKTFDLSKYKDWGFPTQSYLNKDTAFAYGTDTVYFSQGNTETNGIKVAIDYNSSNKDTVGIIVGKTGASITLSAFPFEVEKIVVYGVSSASTTVKFNVFVGETPVSDTVTSCVETQTFNIIKSAQVANTRFTLKITNNKNAQFSKIEIFKKSEKPSITCDDVVMGNVGMGTFNTKTVKVMGSNLSAAIVPSMKDGSNFSVEGTLTADGGDVTITATATTVGAYKDTLILTSGEIVKKVEVSADVKALSGNGSKESPFSIADLYIINNPNVKAWVVGYIVGSIKNNKVEATPSIATNIALSDTKTLTKDSIFTPVQLPTGDIRTALNVVDNAKNIGKQVKVYGSLETYFNMPGVKSVTDYEFIGETAVENIESTSKAIKRYDAELGQVVIIRNGIKYNAIGVKLGTVAE